MSRFKRKELLVAVLAVFFVTGCAAPNPPTDQARMAVWLSESPRSIAISVAPELPVADLVFRDQVPGGASDGARSAKNGLIIVGSAAGGAAIGALYAIAAGCSGGPIGCVVGLYFAPVGAVVGAGVGAASGVRAIDENQPGRPVQGATQKITVNNVIDLPELLAAAIVSYGPVHAHTLQAVKYDEKNQPLGATEGALRLRFHTFQFSGEVGDDPKVALRLGVLAEMQTSTGAEGGQQYSYEGSSRRVSAWRADDARLLKQEMDLAVRSLATSVVRDFFGSPPATAAVVSDAAAQKKASRPPELARWEDIWASSKLADFEDYLEHYPDGQFAERARGRLAVLSKAAAEEPLWRNIRESSNPADFEDYLERYPSGQYAEGARWLLEVRSKVAAAEEPLWENVRESDNPAKFADYLERYPTGKYAERARARIEVLSKVAEERERVRLAELSKAAEERERRRLVVAAAAERAAAERAAADRAAVENLAAAAASSRLPVVGEIWVYRHTDLWTRDTVQITHTVTAANKGEITENLSRRGGSPISIQLTHAPEILLWTLAPVSLPEFAPFGMAAGLLTQGHAIANVKGVDENWSVNATVQGEEDISVPAGRFRATKVVLRGSGNFSHVNSALRGAPGGGVIGSSQAVRFEMSVWYAPEIKRYIKSTYNSFNLSDQAFDRTVYELVSAAPTR